MLTPVPPRECSRAREAVSALLDGELPELERAFVDAHLNSCPVCSAFASSAALVAQELRCAPLERPQLSVFVPQRRRGPRFGVAAAAAVAVAAGSFLALGQTLGVHAHPIGGVGTGAELQTLRRDTMEQYAFPMLRRLEASSVPRLGRMSAL